MFVAQCRPIGDTVNAIFWARGINFIYRARSDGLGPPFPPWGAHADSVAQSMTSKSCLPWLTKITILLSLFQFQLHRNTIVTGLRLWGKATHDFFTAVYSASDNLVGGDVA
jgi:hypothetical protein